MHRTISVAHSALEFPAFDCFYDVKRNRSWEQTSPKQKIRGSTANIDQSLGNFPFSGSGRASLHTRTHSPGKPSNTDRWIFIRTDLARSPNGPFSELNRLFWFGGRLVKRCRLSVDGSLGLPFARSDRLVRLWTAARTRQQSQTLSALIKATRNSPPFFNPP